MVDVAKWPNPEKGGNPPFLPRVGEIILLPLELKSWARYKVLTLEYFMDYGDDPSEPESQTYYFKIAIYAGRER